MYDQVWLTALEAVETFLANDPLFITGFSLMGMVMSVAIVSVIPWKYYRKKENCLYKNLDTLVNEYKIEITRAINTR